MSTPRDRIRNVRDYERFLRSRGFSRTEAKRLATAWHLLDTDKHLATPETQVTVVDLTARRTGGVAIP